MAKKTILIGILCISFFILAATGHGETVCTIINNLKNQDDDLVEATCKKLGLERGVIGLEKVQLLSPCFEIAGRSLFIVGLSWEGPIDGYLILLDKDGNVIDKSRVGYIGQLSLAQLKQEDLDDFLLVDAIKGTGAGMRVDQYTIIAITNKGFLKLWEGLSYERSAPGLSASDDNYEMNASVTFEDIDKDGNLELLYHKKIVKYRYLREKKRFKAEPSYQKTEIYKLKKTSKQEYIFEKSNK